MRPQIEAICKKEEYKPVLNYIKDTLKFNLENIKLIELSTKKNIKIESEEHKLFVLSKYNIDHDLYHIFCKIALNEHPENFVLDETIIETVVANKEKIIQEILKEASFDDNMICDIFATPNDGCSLKLQYGNLTESYRIVSFRIIKKYFNDSMLEDIIEYYKQVGPSFIKDFQKTIRKYKKEHLNEDIDMYLVENIPTIENLIKNNFKKNFGSHKYSYGNEKITISTNDYTASCEFKISDVFDWIKPKIKYTEKFFEDVIFVVSNDDEINKFLEKKIKSTVKKLSQKKFFIEKCESTKLIKTQKNIEFVLKKHNKILNAKADLPKDAKLDFYLYLKDLKTIYVEIDKYDCDICIKNNKVEFDTEEYDNLLNEFTSKSYIKAEKEILSEIYKLDIKASYISGMGLLYGDTTIQFENTYGVFNYDFTLPSYTDSLTNWRKAFLKDMKEVEKNIKKLKNEVIGDNKYELYGYFIPKAIVEFVRANEKYITSTATAQYLHGTQVLLNTNIINTNKKGIFDIFSKEEITNIIDNMVKEGILSEKRCEGTYGTFYILKTTKNSVNVNIEPDINLSNIKNKIKTQKKITDLEAKKMFSVLKQKEGKTQLVPEDYLQLLYLMENKGFICVHRKEYINFTKKCAKEFKELIEMKMITEKERWRKKIYKEMIS